MMLQEKVKKLEQDHEAAKEARVQAENARKRVLDMEQEMQKLRASKDEELKQLMLRVRATNEELEVLMDEGDDECCGANACTQHKARTEGEVPVRAFGAY